MKNGCASETFGSDQSCESGQKNASTYRMEASNAHMDYPGANLSFAARPCHCENTEKQNSFIRSVYAGSLARLERDLLHHFGVVELLDAVALTRTNVQLPV
jgi:hypothetical protein